MVKRKYVTRLLYTGLILMVMACVVLYRYYIIKELLLQQIISQHNTLAQKYKSLIWDKHMDAISILSMTHDALYTNRQFINYVQASNNFLQNSNAEIIVYDREGNKIFTNVEQQLQLNQRKSKLSLYDDTFDILNQYFLGDYISTQPMTEAYQGRTNHILILHIVAGSDHEIMLDQSYVSSYIPLINADMGVFTVGGILQITTEVTREFNNIIYLEQRMIATFIAMLLIFATIIWYNNYCAYKILSDQFDASKILEAQKTKAELENISTTNFVAHISHELRTPLNAIIGFSEIILAGTHGILDNEHYMDYIHDINVSGKHLLSLINDILDFSKASAGKLFIDQVELDLNKLVVSTARLMRPKADEAMVTLTCNMPADHTIITADPKRLKQVLLNLLSNAVKFTPAHGSVTVHVKKDPAQQVVHIIVQDTGIGMRDQEIPKALSLFGQIHNQKNKNSEGTGLGLPLTQKFVELMNGQLNIQSKPLKGTKVTATFKYVDNLEL